LEWIESANRNEIRRGLERRFFPTNDRPEREGWEDGPEGELPTALLGFEDGKSAGKTLVRDEGRALDGLPVRIRNPTTSFLTAATLIYAIEAGITAAAGTRLALQ